MLIKFPKDDKNFSWTRHIKNKMIFYGLSEAKIKSVLKTPKRKEEGVALNTVAIMRRNDKAKKKEEIWVMYQTKSNRKSKISNLNKENQIKNPINYSLLAKPSRVTMISAWRYPGVSKPGNTIPIPDDILNELESILN